MVRPTAMLALLAVAGLTAVMATAQPQPHAVNLPPDVTALITRRTGCQDPMNEPHAGATDAVQVAAVRRSLGCSDIARDEEVLRRKYADSPKVLAALDATWVKVIQRVPVTAAPESPQPSASEPSAK